MLSTKGGGTIDFGSCQTKRLQKNRLSIVGGTEALESEFPHMASTSFNLLIINADNVLKSTYLNVIPLEIFTIDIKLSNYDRITF